MQPITDVDVALATDEIAVWQTKDNVLSTSTYQRGDVDAALASSAHVVRETFQTQRIEHAFLEPEATLAVPSGVGDARRLHVYSGGQGVWDDRNDIARVLKLPNDHVTVELITNGGAFGGKEDMSNQAHAALAAWLINAPVKCVLSREESLLMHAKRHPIRMSYELACDAEGTLTALRVRAVGDSGAYASVGMKVLERMAGHASGPYHLPTIDVESIAVRTNNPVGGAFRGFGANQAQFAMEGMLDRLAERVGLDSWEIRRRNVIRPGMVWGPGQVMDDGCNGALACLDAIKPHYDAARASGKAVGLGLGLKNSGLGNGFKEITRAVVRIEHDGTLEVRHGWTEMGQGINTVAMQVAIEELGSHLPIDEHRVRVVEGSIHMGLGYALTEDFPHDPATGFPTNMTLRSLGILRAKDVPPMTVLLVESPQPNAPYGIKGVGEIGLVPTAGAVAKALHELDGVWRNQLPMRRSTSDDD
ncbi:MAG: hypothetical protein EBT46_01920 [Actinobacteria bacterium]|nr:hypothetical protein [Actinomycetota bacterium]